MKSILFKSLTKIRQILKKIGVSKKIPGVLQVHNFLYRIFWPYKNIIEIQGSKMKINPNDESFSMRETFEGYATNLIHEKTTTNLFKKIVKKGNVVVDLGANIGYFTLLAAKLVGPSGKVYAFEPEPKNFNYLKDNIKINNYNHVFLNQKAVSDKQGITKLFICSYDTGHHTINQNKGIEVYSSGREIQEKSIEIETIILDDFLRDKTNKVDILKIDVEGAELLAVKGMKGILEKNRNIKILLEFFPLLIKEMGSSPKELMRILVREHGFNVFVVGQDYAMNVNPSRELLKVNSFKEITGFLKEESDHVNLFLTR
ncbi:MAG: FkbM family methyltransferase [Candidatus Nealsonbacteria bacterium]